MRSRRRRCSRRGPPACSAPSSTAAGARSWSTGSARTPAPPTCWSTGTAPWSPARRWRPVRGLDPTRRWFRVTGGSRERGGGDDLERGRGRATVMNAAESVGVAQRAMEMAVEYAKERKQFDRAIGSYQAVSHACAQMLLEVEGARSAVYWAAWALDYEPETAPLAVAVAKAYAADAGRRVPRAALQVHGGIGFTWEHDLHFFLKRGEANAHAYGDAAAHRERVATLAGL